MSLKKLLIGIAIFTLFFAGILVDGKGDEVYVIGGGKVLNLKFGLSLTTDKAFYTAGQPITMELCVFNRTGNDVAFHFNNARRFDFFIESGEGKELWRWSNGRMFAQVLGEETLGPGREEITYTASYKGKLEPGIYKITGILVDKEKPMSGSITVTVRYTGQ